MSVDTPHSTNDTPQRAEDEWAQIFDSISDPISIVTADYRLVRANAAYRRLFGLDAQMIGEHLCFSVTTGADTPCESCPLLGTLATQKPGYVQQEHLVLDEAAGTYERRIYQRWTYPIVNADGTVDRAVEILKDVTEQEHGREAATQAAALQEADQLKAELLATVSHELRSPLTSIKGYAATLLRHERRLTREERHEFLMAIESASDRLESLINRLLEMSELETGAIRPLHVPVNIARIVHDAVSVVGGGEWGRSGHHTFRVLLFDKRDQALTAFPPIPGDPRLLRELLDNLLENAVKYSPNGSPIDVILRLATAPPGERRDAGDEPHDGSSRQLEIVVSDAGPGIPEEHLGRIFDRFHRVDARLTREVDGLGLGLAICKRIVELHDGTIWAESTPSEGSSFHVLLPADSLRATVSR